jgi:drug/metabolite transporter (DMT)-like permease
MDGTRASDAEREQVAERLRAACVEGRLEPAELDERLAAALRARTRGELLRLVADLPTAAPAVAAPRYVRAARPPASTLAVRGGVALLTLVTVLALLVPAEAWLPLAIVTVVLVVTLVFLLTALAPFLAAGAVLVVVLKKLGGAGAARPRGPETPWS